MDQAIEAKQQSRAPWIVWALLSTLGLAIAGLIIGAPLAAATSHSSFALAIYKVFSFVCHQHPERSFHLDGHQFAVCSRCTGLYSGFALAALVYPLTRSLKDTDTPSRLWLILAAVPLTVDFALTYFGVWQNTHLTRFSTGALLGVVAAFFIVPGLSELSAKMTRSFNRQASSET